VLDARKTSSGIVTSSGAQEGTSKDDPSIETAAYLFVQSKETCHDTKASSTASPSFNWALQSCPPNDETVAELGLPAVMPSELQAAAFVAEPGGASSMEGTIWSLLGKLLCRSCR
jgi:hypothetical protein